MLDPVHDIRPISYIKAHTAEMIKQVVDNRNPVFVTQNGEAKAVILDVNTYQNLLNSISVMKLVSIGDRDIQNGKIIAHDALKQAISKILD